MPTKRTRRAHHRRAAVSPTAWAFLNDQPMPEDHDEWEEFALDYNHNDEAAKLWEVHGDEVTAAWVRERPGTRPRCWWRFSAPRLAEQQPHQFWPDIDSRRHLVSEH